MKLFSLLCGALFLGACGHEEPKPAQAPAPATSSPAPTQAKKAEPASPAPAARETAPPPPSHASESCGELAMTRAALLAGGKGEQHPEVHGVDALLAKCTDTTPPADACKRVDNEITEKLATGHGEGHPTIQSLRAKQKLCVK